MDADEEDLGEKYDRYLEQRLQMNNEVDLLDLESDNELNRNTFDVGDVSTDFDFSATGSHTTQQQTHQLHEVPPPALSLAEIEEMMRKQAHAQRQQIHYSAHYPPPHPVVQSMSLEEVEKQMRMQMAQNRQPAVRSNLHQPTVLKNDNPITLPMEQKLANLKGETEPKNIPKRSKESKQKNESKKVETLPASKFDDSVLLEPVFNELEFPTLGQVAEIMNQKLQQPASQPSRTILSHPRQNQKQRKQQSGSRSNILDLVDDMQEGCYDGLMRNFEKELIAKIQISNLVTDDPYLNDFYYQIYSRNTNASGLEDEMDPSKKTKSKQKKQLLITNQLVGQGNSAAVSDQMKKQMKRLVDQRKQRPQREGSLSLEGALGKIIVTTSRNPKKALGLTSFAPVQKTGNNMSETKLSRAKLMKNIEVVYDCILNLEKLHRQVPNAKPESLYKDWEKEVNIQKHRLFTKLHVMENNVDFNSPHLFVTMLNFSKMLKAFPRFTAFMKADQIISIFSLIFNRFENLESITVPLDLSSEQVDLFMNLVLPPFVEILSEKSLDVINGLTRIFIERHDFVWVCRSRVGLAIMTAFLSRAEILKSNQESSQNDTDVALWNEIYNFIFSSLQGKFTTLFPDNICSLSEVYLWQFLSALAVGASGIEHQRILVTEVRENVIKTSKSNDANALDNVNLFLKALGLQIDAQQLAAMG